MYVLAPLTRLILTMTRWTTSICLVRHCVCMCVRACISVVLLYAYISVVMSPWCGSTLLNYSSRLFIHWTGQINLLRESDRESTDRICTLTPGGKKSKTGQNPFLNTIRAGAAYQNMNPQLEVWPATNSTITRAKGLCTRYTKAARS